jgi:hypothetical protein
VPIQIPAHLAERSQDLVEALQQRRVMRLGSVMGSGTGGMVMKQESVPQLNPSLRGRGIAPFVPAPKADVVPSTASWGEREALVVELEASREECRRLQALNEALQGTLTTMTEQLWNIQRAVETLTLRQGPVPQPPQFRAPWIGGPARTAAAVPHFIPPTTLEAAEVRINPREGTSISNLDEAVAALRSLRGKSA